MRTKKVDLFVWIMVGIWIVSLSGIINTVYAQQNKSNITDFHKILRERIDKLSKGDWNKLEYNEIHEKITLYTPKLKGEEDVFKKYLEDTYAQVLVRSIRSIMIGVCTPEHKKLEKMMEEVDRVIKLVSNTEDLNTVRNEYKMHQEVLGFISRTRTSRRNGITVTSKYDENYISITLDKRRGFQNKKNWTCTSIKEGLDKIPAYLNERHKNFLTRLVAEYLKGKAFNQAWNDNVERRIQDYYSSATKKGFYIQYEIGGGTAGQFCQVLLKQIADYNEEIQKDKKEEEGL